ncbi:AraC family transcriptional regulator [Enterococcus sp. BWT-B8]|uniref:AraC family transcriptional regulator n=1 Tax=Enterococcus sp. BWT-B8 TaxID=2885157 RepID=UPI001E5CC4E1|nr:AraC family transcriptional regulator [Enterococcus sp. BWT-B8]MCB5952875.1 AraC family transcriptional regulator [Enterococcus sp. BWT-B8]
MLQQLNQLMDYIEQHLTEELFIEDEAKRIGLSEYHLRRTFSFIAGMPLSEYIKNRKLASANLDLVKGEKVTAVAFKYGYQSIEGFSRAFRDWTGYLPSEVSKSGLQKTFPKCSFFITVQGGESMHVKLEKKEAFNLVGVTKKAPIQFEGENNVIVELAQSITEKQRKEMHELGDLYPHQVMNASYGFSEGRMEEKGELIHLIGFLTTSEKKPETLELIRVPANLWAIFPNEGPFPATLQETWGKIYSEWLPSSDYELVEAPEISFTKFEDKKELYSELWIAVKRK